MPYCSICGQPIDGNAKFCPKCGKQNLQAPILGNQVFYTAPKQAFSTNAHKPQQNIVVVQAQTTPRNRRSRGLALVLCFFLGCFGIHQFYLGNSTKGIIYLLGTIILGPISCGWLLIIPAIAGLVDFFIILCMSESEFNERYSS